MKHKRKWLEDRIAEKFGEIDLEEYFVYFSTSLDEIRNEREIDFTSDFEEFQGTDFYLPPEKPLHF